MHAAMFIKPYIMWNYMDYWTHKNNAVEFLLQIHYVTCTSTNF
jgi:hypothetical protein